jgi:integrase
MIERFLTKRVSEIDETPFTAPIPSCRPRPGEESRAVEPEDRDAMLAVARKARNRRDYAVLCFLTETGCRGGALRSLTFRHLHLKEHKAWVREKGRDGEENWCWVYFADATEAALEEWLSERGRTKSRYVFTSLRDDRPMTSDALVQLMKRIAKRAGVERNYNAHAWRHEVGQRMADDKQPLSLIQAKLNHSSPEVTAYVRGPLVRLNQDDKRLIAATEALSPLKDVDEEEDEQTEGEEGDEEVQRAAD